MKCPTKPKRKFNPNRTVVTSVRPPAVVADAISRIAKDRCISRSHAIRELIDRFLDSSFETMMESDVRMLYARLDSKMYERGVSFACPKRRLRSYQNAARILRARSLAGLLSLSVAHEVGEDTLISQK